MNGVLKIFDLVVIGGGVAGIAAAMRVAKRGKKVALVEKDAIGGVHVNWGGIPTKALISSVEILKKVKGEDWYRTDAFKNKEEVRKYIKDHFDVFRKDCSKSTQDGGENDGDKN